MNKNDLREFKEATKEIYNIFFSKEVYFIPLLVSTADNIYHEVKKGKRKYGKPIRLTASVNMNPLEEKSRADLGASEQITATFEVPTILLEETRLINIPISELKKGKIRFKNVDYNIINIRPITNLDEIFLFYLFEVGGIY